MRPLPPLRGHPRSRDLTVCSTTWPDLHGHLESEADDRLTGLDRVTRVLARRADVYGGRSAPSLQETGGSVRA